MQTENVRLMLYSSLAIVLLVLVWGLRQIPNEARVQDQILNESLDQELILLSGAVKSTTEAMKFRLLDVLKADGNDHSTRSFQDSPFVAALLLEWDQVQWKTLWSTSKLKTNFQTAELESLAGGWPLSQMALNEVHFVHLPDVQGQSYFALLLPVRRPNQVPMVGVGIFPAAQFGLSLSAESRRDIRVVTQDGYALALSHPAYLGAQLKGEPLIARMVDGDQVAARMDWSGEKGAAHVGVAAKVGDSNLLVALQTLRADQPLWSRWLYLILCGLGAAGINWALLMAMMRPAFSQLQSFSESNEQLRRQLQTATPVPNAVAAASDAEMSFIPHAKLPDLDFREPVAIHEADVAHLVEVQTQTPTPKAALQKVVASAVTALGPRIQELGVTVNIEGLELISCDADALQLQTAIEEVLKNSLEAMVEAPEKRLTIRGQALNGVIELTIEDTGTGVSTENLPRVFEPFFSTKSAQGLARGLGLNVVRRVIEELKGEVQLVSGGSAGPGTRVEIRWPTEAVTTLENSRTADAAISLETSTSAYILDDIAEDLALLNPVPRAETREEWPDVSIRKPKVRTLD